MTFEYGLARKDIIYSFIGFRGWRPGGGRYDSVSVKVLILEARQETARTWYAELSHFGARSSAEETWFLVSGCFGR
jgi:hypothetical protein